jgi:hypothetical protein
MYGRGCNFVCTSVLLGDYLSVGQEETGSVVAHISRMLPRDLLH